MDKRKEIEKRLNITADVRDKHNYHLDSAFDGAEGPDRRYLTRLPDRTLVPLAEYEDRLRAYNARLAAGSAAGRIRVASADDGEALARLVTQLGYPTTPAAMRRRLTAMLAHDDYETFVAEVDGRVVGFAGVQLCLTYNRDRPNGRITSLVVDEPLRGKSIGSRLVRHLEDWLVAVGAGGVFVNSRSHRVAAHRFYERLGYEQNGVRMVRTFDSPQASQ